MNTKLTLLTLVAIGVVIGFASYPNGYGTLIAGCFIASPVAWCIWKYLALYDRNLKVAFTPVPSPAEVEQQLRREGYDPSISDVMAVHQYLVRNRDNAAVTAAAMGLGTVLMAHQARTGRLL